MRTGVTYLLKTCFTVLSPRLHSLAGNVVSSLRVSIPLSAMWCLPFASPFLGLQCGVFPSCLHSLVGIMVSSFRVSIPWSAIWCLPFVSPFLGRQCGVFPSCLHIKSVYVYHLPRLSYCLRCNCPNFISRKEQIIWLLITACMLLHLSHDCGTFLPPLLQW